MKKINFTILIISLVFNSNFALGINHVAADRCDFNGDGFDDFTYIAERIVHIKYGSATGVSEGNGPSQPSLDLRALNNPELIDLPRRDSISQISCLDVNGDGLSEFIYSAADATVLNGSVPQDLGLAFHDLDNSMVAGGVAIIAPIVDDRILTSDGNIDVIYQGADASQSVLESGDSFGEIIASGDFNDDGFSDIAVSAPSEDIIASAGSGVSRNAGALTIYYGTETGIDRSSGVLLSQFFDDVPGSTESQDAFGQALATGDLDGDGFDDLVVGVPSEDFRGGQTEDAGLIHVFYGSDLGITTNRNVSSHQASPGNPARLEASDNFGQSLIVADFNGDGRDDLAVGVPTEDFLVGGGTRSLTNAGIVQVFYSDQNGFSTTDVQSLSEASPGVLGAAGNDDRFGEALTAGDFDGDGFADLVVVYENDNDGRGAVNIVFGSEQGLVTSRSQRILSNESFAPFYGRFTSVGDFNGDGMDDVLIGSPESERFLFSSSHIGHLEAYLGSVSGINLRSVTRHRFAENPGF